MRPYGTLAKTFLPSKTLQPSPNWRVILKELPSIVAAELIYKMLSLQLCEGQTLQIIWAF
jgi:hypothetical protein